MRHPKDQHWNRGSTGRVVCRCGEGYGSEYDGLCTPCRGETVQEALKKSLKRNHPCVDTTGFAPLPNPGEK